jgi:hypothetical protein
MPNNRSEYKKQWYQNNKTALLLKAKEYALLNKDKISAYQKEYKIENKSEIAKQRKEHYTANKSEIMRKNIARDLKRRRIDPAYKLRRNCSTMIWQALQGRKNGLSILSFLPYSMEDLKKHLENQFDNNMTWENYGKYWHIDHNIPQSKLPYTSMKEENFAKCWALSNLRPLEALENIKKSNK